MLGFEPGCVIDLQDLHNDPQIVDRGQIIRPQIPRCVTCLLMADEIMTKVPNLARLVLADDYSLCWNVVSSNSILLL